MKRLTAVLLCFVMILSLAACDLHQLEKNTENSTATQPDTGSTESIVPEDTQPSGETESTVPENTEPVEDRQPTETSSPTEETNIVAFEALWDKIAGCWVYDTDRFVYFTYNDEGPAFLSGFWDNPVPYNREPATVKKVVDLGMERYRITVLYPPNEENAADEQDLQPLEYTVVVEIPELDKGIIQVQVPDSDALCGYSFGGYSYDDAYDATYDIQYATFEQMQEFWRGLTGYWNSEDGRFLCFDQKDSNSLIFMEGIWDSGSRGWADFEKAMSGYMDLPMKFVVYYPPVSNELDGDLPGEYVVVYVDFMDEQTHNRISVRIGENGEWIEYKYAGISESEAYPGNP